MPRFAAVEAMPPGDARDRFLDRVAAAEDDEARMHRNALARGPAGSPAREIARAAHEGAMRVRHAAALKTLEGQREDMTTALRSHAAGLGLLARARAAAEGP